MSIHIDRSVTHAGPKGERANRASVEHSGRFERTSTASPTALWCHLGGGLSDISSVEAPDGLVVVDGGDSREEAAEALAARRSRDAPRCAPRSPTPGMRSSSGGTRPSGG